VRAAILGWVASGFSMHHQRWWLGSIPGEVMPRHEKRCLRLAEPHSQRYCVDTMK